MKDKDRFKHWLTNQRGRRLTEGSADSYCSYLTAIENGAGKEFGDDLTSSERILKDFSNWSAAIKAYKEYLGWKKDYEEIQKGILDEISETVYEDNQEVEPEISEKSLERVPYDIDVLKRNFRFRLLTQDRYNDSLFYPIRLLARLFTNVGGSELKERFQNWLEDDIDGIRCHISADPDSTELFSIKNFDCLGITPDGVALSGSGYMLHTPSTDNDDFTNPTKFEKIKVARLSRIHIDHTPSMKHILESSDGKYRGLQRLTDMLRADYGISKAAELNGIGKRIFDNEASKSRYLDEALLTEIMTDLEEIKANWTLTLVSAAYNLKKNAKGY